MKKVLISISVIVCILLFAIKVNAIEFETKDGTYLISTEDVTKWPFSSVTTWDRYNGNKKGKSSAVVVGKDYVLTAGHSYNGVDTGSAFLKPGGRPNENELGEKINPMPYGMFTAMRTSTNPHDPYSGSHINAAWGNRGKDYALVRINPIKNPDGTETHIGDVVKPLTIPSDIRVVSEQILKYGSSDCAAILGYRGIDQNTQRFTSIRINTIPYDSNLNRTDSVIQGQAWFGKGYSGGPLLNSIGQVIGIYHGSNSDWNPPRGTFANLVEKKYYDSEEGMEISKTENLLTWGLNRETSRLYFFTDKDEWDVKRKQISPQGEYLEKTNGEYISAEEMLKKVQDTYGSRKGFKLTGLTDGLLEYNLEDTFRMPASGGLSVYPVWESQLWGDVPWDFDADSGVLTFIGGGTLGTEESSPWKRSDSLKIEAQKIKKIVFTEKVKAPVNSYALFGQMGQSDDAKAKRLSNLESIENLNYIDTSEVTDMSYMFAYSGSVNLDVSSFNTSKVFDMHMMFGNNPNLEKLDVSNFDLSEIVKMSQFVSYNTNLETLIMPNSSSPKLNNTYRMFAGVNSLTNLDLSKLDMTNVVDIREMLSGTTRLNTLTLGEKSIFSSDIDLNPINQTGQYTGYWENIGSNGTSEQPKGDNIWTSSELMTKYDGSKDADTYVWQPVSASRTTLNVKNSSVFKGNNWTASDNLESATDRFGNQIFINDITVSGADSVNTNVSGSYQVTYTNGDITKTVTVTVLDYLLGDINNDGVVNIDDLIAFAVYLNTGETPKGVSEEYVKQAGNLDTTGSDPNAINIDDYIALIIILNNM